MSKHNSKLLKVYEQCQKLLKLKRKFLQEIQVPSFPSLQNYKQFSTIKDYTTIHYVQIALSNFFKQAQQSYAKYSLKISSKKTIEHQIQTNIRKIKNTKDLTSKHQQLQNDLYQLKKKWENQEPLVYYEISQRTKFVKNFQDNLTQFKDSLSDIKTIKNPHYFHKLINQFKQNLEQISLEDKQYDEQSEDNAQKISRQLRDLTKQMEMNIENVKYRSFIFEQKKKLFSQFLEINNSMSRSPKGVKQGNLVRSYFEQLLLVSKDIKDHFRRLINFVQSLIRYFKQVQGLLKEQSSRLERRYQQFMGQAYKNKQIRVIFRTDIQEKIYKNMRGILSIGEILKEIQMTLGISKESIIQCYNEASNYHQRYIGRQLKFKETTDSFEKMLIEHKGYFSSLEKKQQKYNDMSIQTLRNFTNQLYHLIKTINHQNLKSKPRLDIPLHQIINKIFAQYNFAEQHTLSDSQSTSSETKDLNQNAKIKEFQKFLQSIEIFQSATVNWANTYYPCSLGPKILIHGYLQILQTGIYYESSFNKKNYFFGKTRLFIPKADIYELNKQKALLVFPDVIEIRVNKGQILFHALGKRDQIYDELISAFFPQVQQTYNANGAEPEMEFNQFKGENTQDKTAFKLTPFSIDFGQSVMKNCELKVIFRRYFSDDSFTYQGKTYQNFKCYQLQHVGGLNPSSNELTPPPPYYFMKKGQPLFSDIVPDHSIRMSTFQKKIPMIPFISKGGNALCEQKSTYYWGSPDFLVIQIQNIMKGFKMTEGMMIKLRLFFKQNQQKNQVRCSTSCEITFSSEGALTGTIKNQALAETKIVIQKTIEAIQKNEKNRSVYKNKGNSIQASSNDNQEFKDEIEKLKHENLRLKKIMKIMGICFFVFYLLTVFWLTSIEERNYPEDKVLIDLDEYEMLRSQSLGFGDFNWKFW